MKQIRFNFFFLFFLVFAVSGCGKSKDSEESSGIETFDQAILDDLDNLPEVPELAKTFGARVSYYKFQATQKEKINKAIEIIKLVIATEEFKSRVLNHTYKGEKTFVNNGGYTNTQIYQKLLEGAERLKPIRNNTLDAEVELYFENSTTIGYTYSSTRRIWVNTKYFNSYTPAGVAHNLIHEWLHKLGFVHATTWSSSRDYSVPYAIGYLVGEIGQDFL